MENEKTPRAHRLATFAIASVLALAVSACAAAGATTQSTASTEADVASTSTSVTANTGRVSANSASYDEIVAALSAAGVDNADRWAREVMEYRPYDTSDPDLTHLRDELAKYNPGEGVVDQIVSALTP